MFHLWRLANREIQSKGSSWAIFTLSHTLSLHNSHLNTRYLIAKLQANLAWNKTNTWLNKFNLTVCNNLYTRRRNWFSLNCSVCKSWNPITQWHLSKFRRRNLFSLNCSVCKSWNPITQWHPSKFWMTWSLLNAFYFDFLRIPPSPLPKLKYWKTPTNKFKVYSNWTWTCTQNRCGKMF